MKLLNRMPMKLYPLYDLVVRGAHLLRGSWYPLHLQEDFIPFFIVGAGRSGTTLLRRILQAGNEVHIPPETYILDDVVKFYMRNCYMPWPYIVHHVLMLFEFHPEFSVFKVSLRPLVQELIHAPKAQRSLAYILDRFYHYHGEKMGATFRLWGDKTPGNANFLLEIQAIFPRARYIHMLRDGVDVVHSYVKNGLIADYEVGAKTWKNAVSRVEVFAKKYPDACLTVRYETFVAKPDETTKSICNFIGIQYQSSMLSEMGHLNHMDDLQVYAHYAKSLQPISQGNIGLGRNSLTTEKKKLLQGIIGDKLASLGYPPVLESDV